MIPQRCRGVAVAAGMGQVGVWAKAEDFEKTDRQTPGLAARHPKIAQLMLSGTARLVCLSPELAAKSFSKQLSEADRKVADDLGDPREMIALFTHAFLRGGRGVVDDYRAIGQPWGVDVSAISVPVRIFQGDADPMVPARHAEELVRRIPGAELVRWPGEGHLAPITHTPEILDWLRQW